MKKAPRKLELSKETLKTLDASDLSKADGGYPVSAVKTCASYLGC